MTNERGKRSAKEIKLKTGAPRKAFGADFEVFRKPPVENPASSFSSPRLPRSPARARWAH
eukprot:6641600-Pyramimonas_sp.AAC.1